MRYPPHILEEIRARLPASAVVGRKVRLKKAGREWRGLSPFNAEKTPSFYVNDGKGRYFDFSAGKDGDIFTFLMETEGLSFPEAVERLAAEAGVELPRASPESERQEVRRRSLGEVMEMAAAFFEANLRKSSGRAARDYLAGREITEETQDHFRLGFATAERFALRDHLAGKGVDSDLMVEAGLLVTGDEVAVPYDRFRDRIMFPIEDGRGPRDCLRRARHAGGRSGQVPELARNAPLQQGTASLQSSSRPGRGSRGGLPRRGRGLHRRDRAGPGRHPPRRCTARDRADRGPDRAALGDGGGADPLFRR